MRRLQISLICLLLFSSFALAQNPTDDEFTPVNKTHLHGRQIDPAWYENINSNTVKKEPGTSKDDDTPFDIRTTIVSELQKVRTGNLPEQAKAGLSSSFKATISQVEIEGRFEIVSLYSPINDNYIRTIEGSIRANVFPPIIARATQQKTSVSVLFTVKKDGKITDIEKENSTNSNALDAAAIGACRSSSPLPPPPVTASSNNSGSGTNKDDIIRMRFTLTYHP